MKSTTVFVFSLIFGIAAAALPRSAQAEPNQHDGLFLQGSLGFGPGWMKERVTGDFEPVELKGVGGTGMVELLIGGTPVAGLVIGGAVTAHKILDPSLQLDGEDLETEDLVVDITQLSVFTNWYPDAGRGLYLHGSFGIANLDITHDGDRRAEDTDGWVFGVGAGYDFWIHDEWSLGPQLRLTYARLTESAHGMNATDEFFAPSVGFTATYH